jgi:hypothetical protein
MRTARGYVIAMQPQEPVINDPDYTSDPDTEVINDPDIPVDAPVDDVYEPVLEDSPDIVD